MLWPKYIFFVQFSHFLFFKDTKHVQRNIFFSVSEWLTDTSNKARNANIWKM